MKSLILIAIFILTFNGNSVAQVSNKINPYFMAIIVNDMDTSLSWYIDILDLEVINQRDIPSRGLRQANIGRDRILIELIEINSSINPDSLMESGSRLQGFFKYGFQVEKFDDFLATMANKFQENDLPVVTDPNSGKRMVIISDPDNNRIQFFEK